MMTHIITHNRQTIILFYEDAICSKNFENDMIALNLRGIISDYLLYKLARLASHSTNIIN